MLLLSYGVASDLWNILVLILNRRPRVESSLFKLLLYLDLGLELPPVILLLLRSARKFSPLLDGLRLQCL